MLLRFNVRSRHHVHFPTVQAEWSGTAPSVGHQLVDVTGHTLVDGFAAKVSGKVNHVIWQNRGEFCILQVIGKVVVDEGIAVDSIPDMSVRLANALYLAGIKNLMQLASIPTTQISQWRNMNGAKMEELRRLCATYKVPLHG